MSPAPRGRRAVFPPLFSICKCPSRAFLILASIFLLPGSLPADPALAGQIAGGQAAPAARHVMRPPPVVSAPVLRPAAPNVRIIRRAHPGVGRVPHRRAGVRRPGGPRFGHHGRVEHLGLPRHRRLDGRRRFQNDSPAFWDSPALPDYGEPDTAAPGGNLVYDEPAYRRYHRQRCVAPKIIQVGPIDKEYGPGPRLIYGSRNRCGSPTYVNAYEKLRANKAKSRR